MLHINICRTSSHLSRRDGYLTVGLRDGVDNASSTANFANREEGPRGLDHVEADEFQGASAKGPILVRVSADEIRSVIERIEKPDAR